MTAATRNPPNEVPPPASSGLAKPLVFLLTITAAINAAVIAATDFSWTVIEGEAGTIFLQPDTSFFARRVRIEIALIVSAVVLWLYHRRRKETAAAIAVVSLGWVAVEYVFWLGGYFLRSDTSEAQEFFSMPHIFYLQKANWMDVWIIVLVVVCLIWGVKRLARGSKFSTR